jgi:hypothetical protein
LLEVILSRLSPALSIPFQFFSLSSVFKNKMVLELGLILVLAAVLIAGVAATTTLIVRATPTPTITNTITNTLTPTTTFTPTTTIITTTTPTPTTTIITTTTITPTIQKAVDRIIHREHITSREVLDQWSNGNDNDIFKLVQQDAPEHWNRLKNPRACVRAHYQTRLNGYKRCKKAV